jgi:dephospho-CoA kinase
MALRVALTGGIASGKSTVAARFAARGVPIIDADEVGRTLLAPGAPLLQQVLARFGPETWQRFGQPLLQADGTLDRRLLRRLIFEDQTQRRALEALMHPAIRARSEELARTAVGPYQLHVVPLLIENHAESRYDRVLVVDCAPDVQLARLATRDHTAPAQARAMLAAQATREARLAAADDVIVNYTDVQALEAQIEALDRRYRALAQSPAPP